MDQSWIAVPSIPATLGPVARHVTYRIVAEFASLKCTARAAVGVAECAGVASPEAGCRARRAFALERLQSRLRALQLRYAAQMRVVRNAEVHSCLIRRPTRALRLERAADFVGAYALTSSVSEVLAQLSGLAAVLSVAAGWTECALVTKTIRCRRAAATLSITAYSRGVDSVAEWIFGQVPSCSLVTAICCIGALIARGRKESARLVTDTIISLTTA